MTDPSVIKMLPDEIWCRIFKQLTNAQDLDNVSKCSLYFRRMLLDHRVYFLFPMILDLLVSKKEVIKVTGSQDLSLVPLCTKNDLRKCRLMCSSWNTCVEQCFSQPAMTGLFPDLNYEKFIPIGIQDPSEWCNPYIFSTLQPLQIKSFLDKFIAKKSGALKNPFLGRIVIFYIDETNGQNSSFAKDMIVILAKFGFEIKHVMIYHRQNADNNNYLQLRYWLKYLPNILSLRLRFLRYDHIEDFLLIENSLPVLKQLVKLDVSNVSIPLVAHIIKTCPITELHIDGWTHGTHWQNPLFKDVFKNLKRVYLHGYRQGYSVLLQLIEKSTSVQTLLVCNREPIIKFDSLFKVIEVHKWLCELTLKFQGREVNNFNRARINGLRLPELKQLTIYVDNSLCIDFVQTLQNLETLEVFMCRNDDSVLDKSSRLHELYKVQFVGFEKRMQQSNIWNILGRLKQFRLSYIGENHIVCYEYKRENLDRIVCRSFTQESLQEIRIPDTYELVFPNFKY